MHNSLHVQLRARMERRGLGAKNDSRTRELSQESRIPRQKGITQISVN